jgi:tetratricopeptide (TPR) repeat protein/transcriptional regulator with XRE-family HTH domain
MVVTSQAAYCGCRIGSARCGPAAAEGREGMLGAVAEPGLSFAGLLRQLRAEAKLTQEELAEAAGLSPRSVSDLERGINRTAHKDTALLLAGALGLAEPVRALFVAVARGKAPAAEVLAARQAVAPGAFAAAATRSLPRDIASFIGRQTELSRLLETLAGPAAGGGVVGIHAIDGMAGIGKTTFAVHAAHQLTGSFPDGQFFLPLHAHTRGRLPVGPADALASLLLTAGVPAAQIPPGLEARAGRWRDQVAGKKILLLLDDAAGHEQVRPLLPGTAGGLVLVTSRRRLAALEDAAQISLDTMVPGDAAALLARLAARPGMRAGDEAVGEITRLCGYLPLAIGMLASQLRNHPTWTCGQLAADLAAARDRLALMHAESVSVAAAFDLSYADLTPGPQRLFRRLGLVPGPSIDAYAAAALGAITLDTARHHLDELYDQHLLAEPAPGRYQLHDLIREHAHALADPAESDEAIGRLLDYYLHTALAAGQHIPAWTAVQGRPPPGPAPADAPQLANLAQAAAWLETERPNLHAAADYAAASGRHLHAVQIPAATGDFLRAHGDWDQAAALHRTALAAARQAGDRPGQALALRQLGILAWQSGDLPAGAASLTQAAALYGETGDRPGQAYALDHLGMVQQLTGDYPAALASRQQALAIARSSGDQLAEAMALNHLADAQHMTGDYPAAAASATKALTLMRSLGHRSGEADALSQLGVVQRDTGDYPAAAASLTQALALLRDLGHRSIQAMTLNDLGLVQQLTGDYAAAAASHQQALELHRDLGSRLGEAETLINLGELASRTSNSHQARAHHTQALALTRSIGWPLQEARALEGLGRSHLQNGNLGEAAKHLQQALTIYQRIGAPGARHVQETLHHHGLTPTTAESPASRPRQPKPTAAHPGPTPRRR